MDEINRTLNCFCISFEGGRGFRQYRTSKGRRNLPSTVCSSNHQLQEVLTTARDHVQSLCYRMCTKALMTSCDLAYSSAQQHFCLRWLFSEQSMGQSPSPTGTKGCHQILRVRIPPLHADFNTWVTLSPSDTLSTVMS